MILQLSKEIQLISSTRKWWISIAFDLDIQLIFLRWLHSSSSKHDKIINSQTSQNNYDIYDYYTNTSLQSEVYEVEFTLNTRTEFTFDAYNSSAEWDGYQVADIKDWFYPRYSVAFPDWAPDLPSFTLNNKIQLNIGTNIESPQTFTPFNDCK